MKRTRFLALIVLFVFSLTGRAQVYYEQWIDGNRSTLKRGSLSYGEQTFSVDVSGVPWPGLHFLNIVPYSASGEPGVWRCIPFLMPEGWPNITEGAQMEYWVTGYQTKPTVKTYQSGELTLSIDAKNFSPGLHFLNFRTMNSVGERGPWKQIAFLMPECWPATAEGAQIEYWLTGYDPSPARIAYTSGEVAFSIDVSRLSPGQHFLNFRTLNSAGERGPWKCIAFMMPEAWPATADATKMEYWISAYQTKPTVKDYTGGEVSLEFDVSQMSYGLHFFNFRTLNARGERGPWKQTGFYLNNGLFDAEEIEYDYWIDNGEAQTGTGYMPGVLDLRIDPSNLSDGTHTFYFKGKNQLGTYGDLFTTTFEVKSGTVGIEDAAPTASERRLTVRAADGALVIDSNCERDINLYLPDGVLARRVHLQAGQNVVSGLQPGVYVTEGLKILLPR